ncbi:pyridoxal phosphate phosphatase PHOSPHO2 [Gracilinanus agilis]|uniref:pyridoxal phosphate phosphatase PHOSPHO2 n=1 Tax=Gracilinanus agilis TaxID=191870 RepID=UPI001CFD5603|nr:pyridoxal phosphate phosphatase PHOSPHO2 [Gracilinanus agilis]XP_044522453.1 pyridoxal phosphate phosphatase PHOSPHO2 [Gracilinanus agilis]
MKTLLVMDFDHTIIDDNSDTWIVKCAPEKKLPQELIDSYQKGKWNEYMGRVFKYLGDKSVEEGEIKKTMIKMPFTEGMLELINFIGKNKDLYDCIIISDSNTAFIDWILKAANVDSVFDKVFTNPAAFSRDGFLILEGFHVHECDYCPKNLCKKKVLIEFIDKQSQKGVKYSQINYIGDGENDFCPITSLKKNDVAFARKGFTLYKMLSEPSQELVPVESSVVGWSSGIEILSYLQS